MHSLYVTYGGRTVHVESDRTGPLEYLRQRFWRLTSEASADVRRTLRLTSIADRVVIYVDDEEDWEGSDEQQAARQLRHYLIRGVIEIWPELLWFHAGAAATDAGAVLLAGRYGAGKSTLITGLLYRGWRYLSDDIVPISPSTGKVQPFPMTPAPRLPTQELVPREQLNELDRIRVQLPDEVHVDEPQTVRAIILPRYEVSTRGKLESVSPTEAVTLLARRCLNRGGSEVMMVKSIAALANTTPIYALPFSTPGDALDAIIAAAR